MDKLEQVKQRIDKFNKDRDWDKFHSPSNLAKSISIEANELLECFQWNDTDFNKEDVKEELADVMNYCIQMSLVLNVDVIDIINDKMDKTEKKYPIDKANIFNAYVDECSEKEIKQNVNKFCTGMIYQAKRCYKKNKEIIDNICQIHFYNYAQELEDYEELNILNNTIKRKIKK